MTVIPAAAAASALGVVAYTYAGYPILIDLLGRLGPGEGKPRGQGDGAHAPGEASSSETYEPTVTACVPAFNAEGYLERKLESLLAQDYPPGKLDVLVFSDGSTDGTCALVEQIAARSNGRVTLIRSDERVGKPTALNRMKAQARGEVLLMTDARQPLVPGALRAMVTKLAPPEVGCVSGNLELEGAEGAGAYWRYEKWIRRNEARFRSMVGVSGAIYVVRRDDVEPLPADLILDDMWVPMTLRLKGRTILFADDAVAFDIAFDDDKEFGRKARTLAGNFQLFSLLPGLLDPRENPSWFETVSHKALRLACPFALAGLFASTASLSLSPSPGPVAQTARALLLGQLAFYALAALGERAGKPGKLARTFVVMNAAAVAGFARWAKGGQAVTW